MLDRSLEDTLPYLFALLGIDDPTASLQQMDPQIRRQRTFAALKQVLVRESLNQPLILIFEDLHWIDAETQGFLDTLSESVASARMLLLVNYRPEYRHEWGQKTYYTQLRLAPLGPEEAGELLTALLGNDGSLTALKRLILAKTEGTPFFMEEVVQTLAEEGVLAGETAISTIVDGLRYRGYPVTELAEKATFDEVAYLLLHGELPSSAARRCATMPQEFLGRMMRTPEIAPRQLDSRTRRSQSNSRRLACSSAANSMGEL